MGCKQSTTAANPIQIGKSERAIPRGVGQTERLISAQQKRIQEASSNGGGPIEVDDEVSKELPKLNEKGQLLQEEVVRRTSNSLNTSTATFGNKDKLGGRTVDVKFAYWSQRGYYPEDPFKANQDDYCITLKFAGEEGDAFLAVFDGHGEQGHSCAKYAKKKLPTSLAKFIRQKRVQRYQQQLLEEGKAVKQAWNPLNWPLLTPAEYELCCKKAFRETNKAMHTATTVEDKLSGTTAVTVCFHGGRMTVCNVGDSRVVLGHKTKEAVDGPASRASTQEEEKTEIELSGENVVSKEKAEHPILAIPLTQDQTPYRKDERERVRKEGAEIKSIDQMEGREEMHDNWGDMVLGERVDIEGDPPRVWCKGLEYPGTAFTRSLGDSIAEKIGVNAEPESVTAQLTVNDKYLIVASDGIFEFVTNQQAIDMCSTCESPLQACELLVKAAYNKWLEHERRTDDITVIVCFLESTNEPSEVDDGIQTTEALVAFSSQSYHGNKPLRSSIKSKTDKASIREIGVESALGGETK